MQEKILKIIFESIDDININKSNDKKILKSVDTRLYGEESSLDSLELITLIVAVEEGINRILSVQITLADDRALTQEISPFSTVKSLLDYSESLISISKNK